MVWKNQNGEAMRRLQKFEDVFIRYDTVHERDRQTDGRTDGRTPHDGTGGACIASRGRNYRSDQSKRVNSV